MIDWKMVISMDHTMALKRVAQMELELDRKMVISMG